MSFPAEIHSFSTERSVPRLKARVILLNNIVSYLLPKGTTASNISAMIDTVLARSAGSSPLDRTARVVFLTQASVGIVTSIIFSFIAGLPAAASAGIGSICAIVPNIAFFLVLRLVYSRNQEAENPAPVSAPRFFKYFQMGEILKLLITVVLFVAILLIRAPGLQILPLFVAFALTFIGHWGAVLAKPPVEVKHVS